MRGRMSQKIIGFVIFLSKLLFLSATRYSVDETLGGYTCEANDIQFEIHTGAYSVIQCTSACDQTAGCKGVFYRAGPTPKCYGCSAIYTVSEGLGQEAGTKYYIPYAKYQESCDETMLCRSQLNQTCEDVLHICVCIPGYSYDPTRKICIHQDECQALGTTYQEYPYMVMMGLDFLALSFQTNVTCAEQCNSYTGNRTQTCKSFDFDIINNICYLQEYTAIDVLAAPVFYSDTSHIFYFYTRNCA